MASLLSPTLTLGAVLSTGYAALFHLLQKEHKPSLGRMLVSSWVGFAAGHVLSAMSGIHLLQIGQLNVVVGTVGAVAALLIARSL